MGVAKSIAMTYSDKEYLLYYLERADYPNLTKLLEKRPELINVKLTENTKMTPLYRAAYNGHLQMVKFLVQKYNADINFVTEAGETALVAAVKRDHLNVVRYLLTHGANPNFVSNIGLTVLQYAILPGYYESALLIYQKCKKQEMREVGEYEEMGRNHRCRYVNYSIFVENLQKKIEPENMPNYLKRVVKTFKDPVVDPRETWGKWFKRQMEFKDPPLVERDELPPEMQPQNKRFGKVTHFLHRLTMSRLSQLPTYEPASKSVMSETGQHAGNLTNQDMEIRTVS